jgi:hypothetical protein
MNLEKHNLYRFPWSKNDNPIAWLEVTDTCNLRCEGCYRQILTGHKPIRELQEEILFFKRWRNPDNVSIAGGEPLLHPEILDIVAFISEHGMKPILLTNAIKLTPEMVQELKRVGLAGFTIHIDSHQGRPGWRGKSEDEHNELRGFYADMIAYEGGLTTIFNSTVYPSTFEEIPDVVRWGQANTDKVHGLVFITYRMFDTDASVAIDTDGQEVDASQLGYSRDSFGEEFITSPEVSQLIKDTLPSYDPSGYLGGTVRHDSFKWLIGAVICSTHGALGSIDKKTMELVQVSHHLFLGNYVAYLSPVKIGPLVFLLAPWDAGLRKTAKRWISEILRDPRRLFSPLRVQTISIIQAPDLQTNGQVDMCDSCPDMTVWDGNLVNSCRMDEYRLYGGLLSVTERASDISEPTPLNEEGSMTTEERA